MLISRTPWSIHIEPKADVVTNIAYVKDTSGKLIASFLEYRDAEAVVEKLNETRTDYDRGYDDGRRAGLKARKT